VAKVYLSAWAQNKISVVHDGIDSSRLTARAGAKITLSSATGQIEFVPGDEILTYVARNLEPVRGFHILMRTLPEVLANRPNAHAIIVGGDDISYGHRPPNGESWKDHMLAELRAAIDLTRVHFVGKISYANYLDLLSISKVHAYWTTPFVLSWSFLEAALSGVPVVASATPPVSEFAAPLRVRTADFFDKEKFSIEIIKELGNVAQKPRQGRHLRELSLEYCLTAQKALLNSVV
jgi:glycosyltransferase involved in cell wall biosynthesis